MSNARIPLCESMQPCDYDRGNVGMTSVTLEPVTMPDSDQEEFLYAVYASTRTQETALTGWPAPVQQQFLSMQFAAQRCSYAMQFPRAEHWIVRHDGVAAGRMILNHSKYEILLVDISLLPEHRRHGVGSLLMAGLMKEASHGAKSIRLHVDRFNPALRWYQQLGFKIETTSEIYLEMVWRPSDDSFSPELVSARKDGNRVD